MTEPLLASTLAYWAERTPEARALTCGEESVSWRQLAVEVEALAAGFAADGVQPGDRIGYLANNSVDVVRVFLAAMALQAVAVPLNPRLTTTELAWIANNVELSAVLADAAHASHALGMREQRELDVYWTGPERPEWARELSYHPSPDRALPRLRATTSEEVVLAVISFTSGTTGHPKGAMLSQGNLVTAASSYALTEDMSRHDVQLLVLSLAFAGSIATGWLPAYHAGAELVMHPTFDAEPALAELASGKVTVFASVPLVFERISALASFSSANLSSLRSCRAGGAPLQDVTTEAFAAKGVSIGQGYGMTESTGVGMAQPLETLATKKGTVGIPMPHVEAQLFDEDGQQTAPGDEGEICLRGPSVMLGYWGDDAATAETIRDGWLRSGDLARVDEGGYFRIVGRSKDMVLSGGLNVYPSEIERVLGLIPSIAECAVFGVPDPKWGEVPVAVIVAEGDEPGAESIIAFCREHLAGYKVPQRIIFRHEPLPRTMSGKVQKKSLQLELVPRD